MNNPKWIQEHEQLPLLTEVFEDSDGNKHRHSQPVIVAYVPFGMAAFVKMTGHRGFLHAEHAVAWLFGDDKWYCSTVNEPRAHEVEGVIAWLAFPIFVNSASL